MKTIEMSIDETLLKEVDQTVYELQMTRAEFINKALVQTLRQYRLPKLEEQDAVGYARLPAQPEEVEAWATEQVWGDEWNAVK
jgi:metal-responsive CopG/Arc/MetJ family transcriptional regulator